MAFSVSAPTPTQDPRAPEVPTVRIPGQPGALARYEGLLVGAASVLVFVAVWQLAAFRRVVPELFLPGPLDIFNAFVAYVAKGSIWPDMWVSGQELIYGFALSIIIGLPLGMLMGWYRRLNEALDPFVTFFYSIPRVALTPLLIIWFGIGLWSKTIIIALVVIFPVTIGTVAGIRSTDRSLLEVATSMGAGRLDTLRKVMVPWALSFILSGARIGVGRGVIGIFVAELFGGASKGVGLMITNAASVFNTPLLFVGIIVLAVMGVAVTSVLRYLERRMAPWRTQSVV